MKVRFLILSVFLTQKSLSAETPGRHELSYVCNAKMSQVVDKFIDPYRHEIGACSQASDCVWQMGGSGVHVNKKFYFKYGECFEYASITANSLCRYGVLDGSPFSDGGFGGGRRPNLPLDYSCEKKQCAPIYPKPFQSVAIESAYKWQKFLPKASNDATFSKEIDKCKAEVNRTFPNLLRPDIFKGIQK